jgi:hypothetical protein
MAVVEDMEGDVRSLNALSQSVCQCAQYPLYGNVAEEVEENELVPSSFAGAALLCGVERNGGSGKRRRLKF